MIGPSSFGRSAVVWQSASTNRAPLCNTKLWAAAGDSDPSNSVWAVLGQVRQPGSDHRQSPTYVRLPVLPGTAAPR